MLSGSAWFWSFSSTIERSAMVRAAARLAGVSSRPPGITERAGPPRRRMGIALARAYELAARYPDARSVSSATLTGTKGSAERIERAAQGTGRGRGNVAV